MKGWRDELYNALATGPAAILEHTPAPKDNIEDVRRKRDIEALRSALRLIHWPTLDEHIQNLPRIVTNRIFHFWEGFNDVVTGSVFHLYDFGLNAKLEALHKSWDQTVSYGFHYRRILNGNYIFDNPDHRPFSSEQEKDWRTIQNAAINLRDAKTALLSHIRSQYVEIDIANLSTSAWIEYCEYIDRPL